MLVGRQDDWCTPVDESVERMKELVLCGTLGGQEMNIVNDQPAGAPMPSAKAVQASGPHRLQEAIGEGLGSELKNASARLCPPQSLTNAFQQVSLAQTNGTVDHEGIERGPG
jgi:hypothetical protein